MQTSCTGTKTLHSFAKNEHGREAWNSYHYRSEAKTIVSATRAYNLDSCLSVMEDTHQVFQTSFVWLNGSLLPHTGLARVLAVKDELLYFFLCDFLGLDADRIAGPSSRSARRRTHSVFL